MPRRSEIRLSKRVVDGLAVERGDRVFYDQRLTGFGVRVHASGRKMYVVHAQAPGVGLRRVSIGRYEAIAFEEARRRAAQVIDRLKRGEKPFPEPAPAEPTVADLAERYISAHVEVNCRPGTVGTFGRIVRLYIVPEFGEMLVSEVKRMHVAALHDRMRDKPFLANQVRDVMAKMFRLAEAWEMVPLRRNPALSIRRYKVGRRERFLSGEEYRRLGQVLYEAEMDGSVSPEGVAAIRLLLVTGCRKNEILMLRWDDIDRTAGELLLRDSKTGARRVPLTPDVEFALGRIPRLEGNPWVIAGQKPGAHLSNLDVVWQRVRSRAGLDDVRVHDCRHSYASRALETGEGIPMISELLGHRKFSTTARYAHLARDGERAAAANVGESMATTSSRGKKPRRRKRGWGCGQIQDEDDFSAHGGCPRC